MKYIFYIKHITRITCITRITRNTFITLITKTLFLKKIVIIKIERGVTYVSKRFYFAGSRRYVYQVGKPNGKPAIFMETGLWHWMWNYQYFRYIILRSGLFCQKRVKIRAFRVKILYNTLRTVLQIGKLWQNDNVITETNSLVNYPPPKGNGLPLNSSPDSV